MKWALILGGLVFDLLGTLWILQGLNVLPGGFMSGEAFWAVAGLVTMLAGVALVLLALRRHAEYG